MDKYGFWGGKWNIGYGRLRVENMNCIEEKKEIILEDLGLNSNVKFLENTEDSIMELINGINDFKKLTKHERKKITILLVRKREPENKIKEIIKELIRIKAENRYNYRENTELRHKIFGKTGNPREIPYVPQGSKILPYIDKINGQLVGGFLSIAGLLNLEERTTGE